MKLLIGLLLSFLFVASASSDNSKTLLIGNSGEPATLDPHKYNLRLEETLLNDLFLGLTTFNANGEIVPGAAESWETSDDGLTWRFFLREELKWSDGKNLTAEDFVYSFRRLLNPHTAASLSYFLYMIKNAELVNNAKKAPSSLGVYSEGPHVLVIELDQPYPYLLERLLYPTGFPVPKHVIENVGSDWVKPEHWVSNGAYVLEDWSPQEHVKMKSNPHFFDDVYIRSLKYIPVASEQSGFNRFRTGELDVIASFPAGKLEELRESNAKALRLSNLLSMMYLVFNTTKGPTQDQKIRKALSLSIDQRILTEKVLRNGHEPAFSFVPELVSNYSFKEVPHKNLPESERLAEAKTLLGDAGYTKDIPLKITLNYASGAENKKVSLAIMGMWKRIGVVASLQQSDLKTHFGKLRQNDFEVAWAGWVGENNAQHYLELLDSSIGDVNYGRYSNPSFDNAIKQARSTSDVNQRNQLLSKAEEVSTTEYPVVPLYTLKTRRLVNEKLKGWSENLRDMHQARYLRWE